MGSIVVTSSGNHKRTGQARVRLEARIPLQYFKQEAAIRQEGQKIFSQVAEGRCQSLNF